MGIETEEISRIELKDIIKQAVREVTAELEEKENSKHGLPIGDWAICKYCSKPVESKQSFYILHSVCFELNVMDRIDNKASSSSTSSSTNETMTTTERYDELPE